MADMDREKFAYHVAGFLEKNELSMRQAQTKFKGITAGLLSKVSTAKDIGIGNILCICHHFDLNPLHYLDLEKPNLHARKSGASNKDRQRLTIAEITNNIDKTRRSTL